MTRVTATSLPADFTESRYRVLLEGARSRFRFIRFGDAVEDGTALWRHDIDFSPQRALSLARLEAEQGVAATYFVLLGSSFYNPLEPSVREDLRQIAQAGHDIGLHYDAALLDGPIDAQVARIAFEAAILQEYLQTEIRCFSLHNPTVSPDVDLSGERYGGLINASAPALREQFTYASDSNGRWRFRSLHDVVADASVKRLYALTHPEWWPPEELEPAARVARCIEGRAERVSADYRTFLTQHRPEVLDTAPGAHAPAGIQRNK